MRSLLVVVSVALVLLLTGATAEAVDHCFEDTSGNTYVAKAFAFPTANNCKPFNGYISGVASAVAGNVCKTKNNAFYYFNLHVNNSTLDAYFVVFNLSATTLDGNGRILNPGYFGSVGTFTSIGIDKVTCPADRFFGF